MDRHARNAPECSQLVRHADVEVSINHSGRVSWRLITLEILGARNLKVLRGTLQPGKTVRVHSGSGRDSVIRDEDRRGADARDLPANLWRWRGVRRELGMDSNHYDLIFLFIGFSP